MQTSIGRTCRVAALLGMLVYFASYTTRNNFAVMVVKICADLGLEKSTLSVVLVAMTVCYGTGQFISGVLGDHINPTRIVLGGLLVTGACNISMCFTESVPVMVVIWGVNGVAQSMLWPPLTKLFSIGFNEEEYSYSMVRVIWGGALANILLYLLCPLLLTVVSFHIIFLICAITGLAIAAVWFFLAPRFFPEAAHKAPAAKGMESDAAKGSANARVSMPLSVFLPLSLVVLGILAMGVLRDGVTNWFPSYMSETFSLSEESAIVAGVVPAVFSFVSAGVAASLHSKWFKNELVCAGVIFLLAVVAALVLLTPLSGFGLVATLMLGLVIASMHGVNQMLITKCPKRFTRFGNVSTMAGVLNAFTYVGAAASTYGFAVLAESKGWGFTIAMWVICSLFGALVCFLGAKPWKKEFFPDTPDNAV